MIHWLNYNGKDIRDYNAFITSKTSYDKPEKDVEFISVPGRNGDIVIDKNRYKNLNLTYGIRLISPNITNRDNYDFAAKYNRIMEMFIANSTYQVLFDSYEPEYYRLACCTAHPTVKITNPHMADFNVTFNCKPFKYHYSGQDAITITQTKTIYNPGNVKSSPKMRIVLPAGSNSASFGVNGISYSVYNVTDYVDIDSETMNVYKGTTLKNNDIRIGDGYTFPTLQPGNNSITIQSAMSQITILPRWVSV